MRLRCEQMRCCDLGQKTSLLTTNEERETEARGGKQDGRQASGGAEGGAGGGERASLKGMSGSVVSVGPRWGSESRAVYELLLAHEPHLHSPGAHWQVEKSRTEGSDRVKTGKGRAARARGKAGVASKGAGGTNGAGAALVAAARASLGISRLLRGVLDAVGALALAGSALEGA